MYRRITNATCVLTPAFAMARFRCVRMVCTERPSEWAMRVGVRPAARQRTTRISVAVNLQLVGTDNPADSGHRPLILDAVERGLVHSVWSNIMKVRNPLLEAPAFESFSLSPT
jgi:hypothetical protein